LSLSARAPEYARKKQAPIDLPIAEGSFEAFPDAVRFADGLHAAGLRLPLASSSKNVAAMLRRVSLPDGSPLLSIFDVDLSGTDVPRGKPDPALFLLAAMAMKVPPTQCVVVEDGPAGIAAARRRYGLGRYRAARRRSLAASCSGRSGRHQLDQSDTAVPDGMLRIRPETETTATAPSRCRPARRHSTSRSARSTRGSCASPAPAGARTVCFPTHTPQRDRPNRAIIARVRHDGCGGAPGRAELLTGIEGASSRPCGGSY
jgi:beta-phosphoglucomutase